MCSFYYASDFSGYIEVSHHSKTVSDSCSSSPCDNTVGLFCPLPETTLS
eukprot:UN15152